MSHAMNPPPRRRSQPPLGAWLHAPALLLVVLAAHPSAAQTINCTSGTSVTANGQQGASGGSFFYGLGDPNGCVVPGGPSQSFSPSAPGLFMYGNFALPDGGAIAMPPLFLSATSSGFTGPGPQDQALGVFPFGGGSTSQAIAISNIPAQGSLPSMVTIWGLIPGGSWTSLGTWNYAYLPPPVIQYPPTGATCTTDASPTPLGNGTAVVHTTQQVPTNSGVPANADAKLLNPRPVLFSTNTAVNVAQNATATAPARVHSWASAMTWANNSANYWVGSTQLTAIQTPIYADPLITFYSSQPRNQDGTYFASNYLTSSPTPGKSAPLGTPSNADLFAPGFHLATASPMTINGDLYSGGTTSTVYNYGGRSVHGSQSMQVGVDPMGTFRETLAVFPSSSGSPTVPAYLPANPTTVAQGDWDIVFRMSQSATTYLQMAVAQGSPFTQFTSQGNSVISIGAVYGPGYVSSPSGAMPGGTITPPTDVTVGSGAVRFQIIYQQVNGMSSATESFPSPGATRSNWVSFAVMWDPKALPVKALTANTSAYDKMTYYTLPISSTASATSFVIAALPNQLQNNVQPSTTASPYDSAAATAWARALAPYAFNFYQGTSAVSFYVGKTNQGKATASNLVNVYYAPGLKAVGPSIAGRTVFLLQPHQYSTGFKDGRNGQMPLNTSQKTPFLSFAGKQSWTAAATNKYWIVRGKLEAYVDTQLSLTYVMPPIVPAFPGSVFGSATLTPAGSNMGTSPVALNDVTYGLIAGTIYPLVLSSPPANSTLANLTNGYGQMNAPYGSAQAMYYTAKLLYALAGLTEPASPPAWYGSTPWLTKGTMLSNLYAQLVQLLSYYFSPQMCAVQANSSALGIINSYVYAYYDAASHHLLLEPTGSGPAPRPQSYGNNYPNGVVDSFGIGPALSDNAYTYGYFIAGAALLELALQQQLIPGLTSDQQDFLDPNHFGPAIDLLIKDIAYADTASGVSIPWWVDQKALPFPRLEYMDLWTGIAFTDAFTPTAGSGKQHNSAQEAQLSWAAIHLWGKVTNRQPLADLGAFLYTLGAYANDAYFNGTLGQLVPDTTNGEYASDFSPDGSFIPRATQDLTQAAVGTWNYNPAQSLTSNCPGPQCRGMSAWQTRPATSTQVSSGPRPVISPGVYQGRQWSQGEDGQPLLAGLVNVLLPFEPLTLSPLRDSTYMTAASQASLLQGGQPYMSPSYMGVNNLFFTALGMGQSAGVSYSQPLTTAFPPCQPGVQNCLNPPPFDTSGTGCQAFLTLSPSASQSGFTWYWNLLTSGGGSSSGGALLPWMGVPVSSLPSSCQSSSPAVQAINYWTWPAAAAAAFVDFYTYQRYGTPNFNVYCEATSLAKGQLQPLCVGFGSPGSATPTMLLAFNPNSQPLSVQFKTVSGGTAVGPAQSIAGYGNAVWAVQSTLKRKPQRKR